MSDFDIELDGLESLQEELDDLAEDGTSDRTYIAGTTVEYGVYLEFGTENMPPYPWFRPAIREFKANPREFIIETTGFSSIDEIPSADALVEAVATGLANRMGDNVNAQDSGANRSPGTDPDHPKRDTGNLTGSIQAVRIN